MRGRPPGCGCKRECGRRKSCRAVYPAKPSLDLPEQTLRHDAANMTGEPGFKIEKADPRRSDRHPRHAHAWLAHLREIGFGAFLAMVTMRRLLEFTDQTVDLRHRCSSPDQEHMRRKFLSIDRDGDVGIGAQGCRTRRFMTHMRPR